MYDIIVFGGQSNMQGQSEKLSENNICPTALEYLLIGDELVPLADPVGENITFDFTKGTEVRTDGAEGAMGIPEWLSVHMVGSAVNGHTTLVPSFCRAYTKKCGKGVVAVSAAKGSTQIDYWLKGGKPYELIVKKTLSAILKLGSKNVGRIYFIWLQGESDAIAGVKKDEYARKLNELNASLRCDIGIDSFGIIRVGRFTLDSRDDEIISAQEEVCKADGSFIMLTRAAEELLTQEEYVNPFFAGHFSTAGYERLGEEAGASLGELRGR